MKTLFLFALPIALAGSPAMSATYSAEGFGTGLPETEGSSGDTPVSVSGGGNPLGFGGTFDTTATNVNGGYASAYAAEGIANTDDYNYGTGSYGGPGIVGNSEASVQYTMEIMGPTTGALVPVIATMFAHVDALSIPGPVGGAEGYYAPIIAGAEAEVTLNYANFDIQLPFVAVATSYNYQYYTQGDVDAAPNVNSKNDSFDGKVMLEANEPINVDIFAEANLTYAAGLAGYSETAVGSAYADPTFKIVDPAFADYTITGVPAGPAAAAAPEPATWAMMLIGFAGLGYTGHQARRRTAKRLQPGCSL